MFRPWGVSTKELKTWKRRLANIARINCEIDTIANTPANKERLDRLYAERERVGNSLNLLPVSYIWHGLPGPSPDSCLL